jgi:nucleoside-diphosphate-sugar epimerase
MKELLIGGTGQISSAVTRKLLKDGWEVWLLNRGNRSAEVDGNIHFIQADMGNNLCYNRISDIRL